MRPTLSDARWHIFCALVIFWLVTPSAAQAPDLDSLIGRVMATHRFSEVQISPDGKRVAWVETAVRNDSEYSRAVYVADARPGANPSKLDVPGSTNQFGIAWSPDSKELAFLAATSTPDPTELRIMAADHSQRVFATLSGELSAVRWSPDGQTISLLCSQIPQVDDSARVVKEGEQYQRQRIALIDRRSGQIKVLTPADFFIYEYDWSPDSRRIAVTAAPCCTRANGEGNDNWWTSALYSVDVDSGQLTSVYKPKWQIASPKWSPDNRHIAFIAGLMSDFIAPGGEVFVVDTETKGAHDVTPDIKASITWIAWTGADKILATEIVDGGAAVVFIHPAKSAVESLWQGSDGPFTGGLVFALSVARDGKTSAAIRESFEHAPEIWVGEVGKWAQLSSANRDQIASWGKAESVHWNSDGMQIQGWLLHPAHYEPGRKYPMVVLVHGGPAAAALSHWAPAFDDVEVLSALGYFVLYPNPRGSMGAGEQFTQGNVKNIGYGDLRDIEAGVQYAIENLPVDPQRVGITGWSYGGYMAMWAITQTQMFRASVAGPGTSNWQSYYDQVDIEKWLIPYFGATLYDEPEIYAKSSPINFVKNAHAATLFYVGTDDNVCPASQSFELWRALRHLGVETEMLLYSGEGHGMSKPADQRDVTKQMVRWFSEHLQPRP